MKLEGIHHITAITGDAPRNVDFYVRVLGLRMVKKSVNQDDPTVYHLFYADEQGSAGADLTFFEYRTRAPGRAGAGMIHRIVHRVASADTLDFWADRLGSEGVRRRARATAGCASPIRRGSSTNCASSTCRTRRWPRARPRCPTSTRCWASTRSTRRSRTRASPRAADGALGFEERGEHGSRRAATSRGGSIVFEPGAGRGFGGAGTIHHIAWATTYDEHDAWRAAGARRAACQPRR